MVDDPILREIRAFRDELAERYKDDPQGFRNWLKSCEEAARRSGKQLVTRAPKRVERDPVASDR